MSNLTREEKLAAWGYARTEAYSQGKVNPGAPDALDLLIMQGHFEEASAAIEVVKRVYGWEAIPKLPPS